MARLPDPISRGALPVPRNTRALPSGSGALPALRRAVDVQNASASDLMRRGDAVGNMLSNASRQALSIGLEQQRQEQARAQARDRLLLSRARAQFAAGDVHARNSFAGDQDYASYEERYGNAVEGLKRTIAGNLPEHLREEFEIGIMEDVARGSAFVQGKARETEHDVERASLEDSRSANIQAALSAPDDTSRAALLSANAESIESARLLGYITSQEAQKMRTADAEEFAAARYEIIPPAARLEHLERGMTMGEDGQPIFTRTGTPLDLIPITKRIGMIEDATDDVVKLRNLQLREQERAERLADKAAKASREDLELSYINRILAGEIVSEGDIIADGRTRNLDGGQVNRLVTMLRSEGAVEDDPLLLLTINDAVQNADPNAMNHIVTGMEAGLLKPATAASLVRNLNEAERRGGPMARDDVKRARRYLDQVVGGVRGPLAVLDTASSIRVANATRAFDETIRALEEKGAQYNASAVADEIAQQYRLVEEPISAMPKPRYLVGSRSTPDVDATRQETLRALDSGEISPEEASVELELLERIEDAMGAVQ